MDAAGQASTPRWLLGIALALPVVLVVGLLVAAVVIRDQRPGPLPLAAVPAPAADSAECAELLAALPEQLDGRLDRRELAPPAPSGAAAWGAPPVVLRCGIERPAELVATSRLLSISGVQFLGLPDLKTDLQNGAWEPRDPPAGTWVAVDRADYVAVTLPPEAGSGPLQQVAEVIAQTLPARQVDIPH